MPGPHQTTVNAPNKENTSAKSGGAKGSIESGINKTFGK